MKIETVKKLIVLITAVVFLFSSCTSGASEMETSEDPTNEPAEVAEETVTEDTDESEQIVTEALEEPAEAGITTEEDASENDGTDEGTLAYAYVHHAPAYDIYYYINTEDQTVRSFADHSYSMYLGYYTGTMDDGLEVRYVDGDEDTWFEDVHLANTGDYSKLVVTDRELGISNEYDAMDVKELEAIINDGNHKDIESMIVD